VFILWIHVFCIQHIDPGGAVRENQLEEAMILGKAAQWMGKFVAPKGNSVYIYFQVILPR
jgi:hypothetical protein